MTAGYTVRTDRKLGEQLAKAVDRLATSPHKGEQLKGEWKGYWKYRTGSYRIIYRVEHERLLIFIIYGNRAGVRSRPPYRIDVSHAFSLGLDTSLGV